MLNIGLTGGIGSGKSTVAALFADRGVPIIDADVIAREVIEPNQPAFSHLLDHFGNRILTKTQALDRKALRDIVFTDPNELEWLESLLHPLIKEAIHKQIQEISAPYCIIVIPLLFETGPYDFLDRILVIDTEDEKQLSRVTQRDQLTPQQAQAMIHTQIPREQRLAEANDVISNNGELADLPSQVEKWHQFYLQLGQST